MSLTQFTESVSKLLLTNGTVVDPVSLKESISDVLIENGELKEIGKINAEGFDGQITDVAGKVVCPGLIDMHVHLREPGREDEETIDSGCDAAMAGGFTAVCSMPNTEPAADNAEVISFIKNRAKNLLVNVYPIAAVTKNRAGNELTEMGDLVDAGAVAFSDDGEPVATSEILRRALEYSSMFNTPIIEHCEDKTLTVGASMHEGEISTRLGLKGIPGISEDIIVARDIQVTEYTKGKLHIAHISTAASVDLVRQAKKRGVQVTCEVMPHHFTLNHTAVKNYDTNAKMNPPLRTQADVDAMLEGLKDGTIDVIATDHAPHAIEEKQVEFDAAPFGIVGLETALGIVIKYLVQGKILSLPQAVAKLTSTPAEILNLKAGRFVKNQPASITIFDPTVEWVVDKRKFKSKSRNTPYDKWDLAGKVFALYNKGLWWQSNLIS